MNRCSTSDCRLREPRGFGGFEKGGKWFGSLSRLSKIAVKSCGGERGQQRGDDSN